MACQGSPPTRQSLSGSASGGEIPSPLLGANCGPDTWSNMKFIGANLNCVAFLTRHLHNGGGSCGRYEDNGCHYDAATGWIQGFASSGTTYCGYVCF
ncbi:MAG TPA: hypothetical protein VNK24_03455 [Elusimicrobiota bacterium]|nr:hypothetical protein [Elusimicrobiota bacterium]